MRIGYVLSSEEHPPRALVRHARLAEEAGFEFAIISDHFHPWTNRQGQSAFVWAVVGGIAEATQRLRLGTGVTCPTMRIHPAIIAQAAATAEALMPGRFFLGVGTGENLNEHVLGQHWPDTATRREMLEEALELIRLLWKGGLRSHRGRHYTVEDARLYTLPERPPPILIAAAGPQSARLAGRAGDGLIGVSPDPELLSEFDAAGGAGKPRYGKVTVCWAPDGDDARRTAFEWWPNAALPGELGQELPLPRHFEQACSLLTERDVAEAITCSPDPEQHLEAIRELQKAGYDHVFVHQVGPDQEGFIRFYEREVIPKVG